MIGITTVAPTQFVPETRTDQLPSAFLQDEITLVPERLRLRAGAKLERLEPVPMLRCRAAGTPH